MDRDLMRRQFGLNPRRADAFDTLVETAGGGLETTPLGQQHPGLHAVTYVREALGRFELPSQVHLRYTGMNRTSGSGAHGMSDGIVWVRAEFASQSGARHAVDVPVVVHDRRMVEPQVLLHHGRARVLAQSTFDDIVDNAEVYRSQPDRSHMFSPPPSQETRERQRYEPPAVSTNSGMFGVIAGK